MSSARNRRTVHVSELRGTLSFRGSPAYVEEKRGPLPSALPVGKEEGSPKIEEGGTKGKTGEPQLTPEEIKRKEEEQQIASDYKYRWLEIIDLVEDQVRVRYLGVAIFTFIFAFVFFFVFTPLFNEFPTEGKDVEQLEMSSSLDYRMSLSGDLPTITLRASDEYDFGVDGIDVSWELTKLSDNEQRLCDEYSTMYTAYHSLMCNSVLSSSKKETDDDGLAKFSGIHASTAVVGAYLSTFTCEEISLKTYISLYSATTDATVVTGLPHSVTVGQSWSKAPKVTLSFFSSSAKFATVAIVPNLTKSDDIVGFENNVIRLTSGTTAEFSSIKISYASVSSVKLVLMVDGLPYDVFPERLYISTSVTSVSVSGLPATVVEGTAMTPTVTISPAVAGKRVIATVAEVDGWSPLIEDIRKKVLLNAISDESASDGTVAFSSGLKFSNSGELGTSYKLVFICDGVQSSLSSSISVTTSITSLRFEVSPPTSMRVLKQATSLPVLTLTPAVSGKKVEVSATNAAVVVNATCRESDSIGRIYCTDLMILSMGAVSPVTSKLKFTVDGSVSLESSSLSISALTTSIASSTWCSRIEIQQGFPTISSFGGFIAPSVQVRLKSFKDEDVSGRPVCFYLVDKTGTYLDDDVQLTDGDNCAQTSDGSGVVTFSKLAFSPTFSRDVRVVFYASNPSLSLLPSYYPQKCFSPIENVKIRNSIASISFSSISSQYVSGSTVSFTATLKDISGSGSAIGAGVSCVLTFFDRPNNTDSSWCPISSKSGIPCNSDAVNSNVNGECSFSFTLAHGMSGSYVGYVVANGVRSPSLAISVVHAGNTVASVALASVPAKQTVSLGSTITTPTIVVKDSGNVGIANRMVQARLKNGYKASLRKEWSGLTNANGEATFADLQLIAAKCSVVNEIEFCVGSVCSSSGIQVESNEAFELAPIVEGNVLAMAASFAPWNPQPQLIYEITSCTTSIPRTSPFSFEVPVNAFTIPYYPGNLKGYVSKFDADSTDMKFSNMQFWNSADGVYSVFFRVGELQSTPIVLTLSSVATSMDLSKQPPTTNTLGSMMTVSGIAQQTGGGGVPNVVVRAILYSYSTTGSSEIDAGTVGNPKLDSVVNSVLTKDDGKFDLPVRLSAATNGAEYAIRVYTDGSRSSISDPFTVVNYVQSVVIDKQPGQRFSSKPVQISATQAVSTLTQPIISITVSDGSLEGHDVEVGIDLVEKLGDIITSATDPSVRYEDNPKTDSTGKYEFSDLKIVTGASGRYRLRFYVQGIASSWSSEFDAVNSDDVDLGNIGDFTTILYIIGVSMLPLFVANKHDSGWTAIIVGFLVSIAYAVVFTFYFATLVTTSGWPDVYDIILGAIVAVNVLILVIWFLQLVSLRTASAAKKEKFEKHWYHIQKLDRWKNLVSRLLPIGCRIYEEKKREESAERVYVCGFDPLDEYSEVPEDQRLDALRRYIDLKAEQREVEVLTAEWKNRWFFVRWFPRIFLDVVELEAEMDRRARLEAVKAALGIEDPKKKFFLLRLGKWFYKLLCPKDQHAKFETRKDFFYPQRFLFAFTLTLLFLLIGTLAWLVLRGYFLYEVEKARSDIYEMRYSSHLSSADSTVLASRMSLAINAFDSGCSLLSVVEVLTGKTVDFDCNNVVDGAKGISKILLLYLDMFFPEMDSFIATLKDAITFSMVTGMCVSLFVILLCYFLMFRKYRQNVFLLRQGKYFFDPANFPYTYAPDYVGLQASHCIVAHVLITLVVSLILFLLYWDPIREYVFEKGKSALLALSIFWLIVRLIRMLVKSLAPFYLCSNGHIIRRKLFSIFDFSFLLLVIGEGPITAIFLLFGAFFWLVIHFIRLDIPNSHPPWKDRGYKSYIGMLRLDAEYGNPVLTVFSHMIWNPIEERRMEMLKRIEEEKKLLKEKQNGKTAVRPDDDLEAGNGCDGGDGMPAGKSVTTEKEVMKEKKICDKGDEMELEDVVASGDDENVRDEKEVGPIEIEHVEKEGLPSKKGEDVDNDEKEGKEGKEDEGAVSTKGGAEADARNGEKGESENEEPTEEEKLLRHRQVSFHFWLLVTLRNNPQLQFMRKTNVESRLEVLQRVIIDDDGDRDANVKKVDIARRKEGEDLRLLQYVKDSSLSPDALERKPTEGKKQPGKGK